MAAASTSLSSVWLSATRTATSTFPSSVPVLQAAAHYILADVLGKEQIGLYIYIVYVLIFFVYAIGLARAQKNICLPIEPDDARGACAWQAGPVCRVVPPGEQADMMDEEDRKNDSAAEIFAALSFVVNPPCL